MHLCRPRDRYRLTVCEMSKVCSFYVQGNCRYGSSCRYLHPQSGAASGAAMQAPGSTQGRGRGRAAADRPSRPQRCEDAAHKTRSWWTAGAAAAGGPRFRVMSYNVLADELAQSHRAELYRSVSFEHLEWSRRWSMIRSEVRYLSPDLLCLQEVDHWEEVRQDMEDMGYRGSYAQRSGGRSDGCATFWRTSCFESVAVSQLNFSDFDLRDNVGLLALLRHKSKQQQQQQRKQQTHSGSSSARPGRAAARAVSDSDSSDTDDSETEDLKQLLQDPDVAAASGAFVGASEDSSSAGPLPYFVAVANTHILFNPKRGDVKVGQLRLLIKHLQALVAATVPAEQQEHVAGLVMGDMNHRPHTAIYNFMRQGWVDCLQQHRKNMAGTRDDLEVNPFRRSSSYGSYGSSSFQRTFNQLRPNPALNNSNQQQQQFSTMQQGFTTQQHYMQQGPAGFHMGQQQQQHHMGMRVQQPLLPPRQHQQQAGTGMAGQAPTPLQQQQLQLQAMHTQQHVQQVQQVRQQQQQIQQQPVLHRSASAPVLTLRKLRSAGWSPEELIIATGGSHGTHLKHFTQLQQQEQQQQELRQQRQQQQHGRQHPASAPNGAAAAAPDGGDSGQDMELTNDDKDNRRAAAVPPPPPPPRQQQQQARGRTAVAAAGCSDSGDDMDLTSDCKGPARLQQLVARARYSAAHDLAVDDSGEDMELASDGEQQAIKQWDLRGAGVGSAAVAAAAGGASAPGGAAGDSDMDSSDDDEQQRRQQQQQQVLFPDSQNLKRVRHQAVKEQLQQQSQARKALQQQGAGQQALLQLQQQQQREREALKQQQQAQVARQRERQRQQQLQQARQQGRQQQPGVGDDSGEDMDVSQDGQRQEGAGSALLLPMPCLASAPGGAAVGTRPGQETPQPLKKLKWNGSRAAAAAGAAGEAQVPPPPPPPQQQQQVPPPPPPPPPPPQQQQNGSSSSGRSKARDRVVPVFMLQGSSSWGRELWDEPLPASLGDGVARHGLQLRSCYAELTGSEPEYTSCHDSFYGTVDYIWYTPAAGRVRVRPVAVLLPPCVDTHVLPKACMPNATIPSDHICLVCDFELSQEHAAAPGVVGKHS